MGTFIKDFSSSKIERIRRGLEEGYKRIRRGNGLFDLKFAIISLKIRRGI